MTGRVERGERNWEGGGGAFMPWPYLSLYCSCPPHTNTHTLHLSFPPSPVHTCPHLSTPRYVHRVGRTARMGHSGEALVLLMPHERKYVELLAKRGIILQV